MQDSTLQPTPEPFPPVNITPLSLEQRVDFAGQLLADPATKEAALATVSISDLHTALVNSTETALIGGLRDFIEQAVRDGIMSTQPVTHVRFRTADYGSGLRYDEDEARFYHADGEVTVTTVEATPADDWLRDLTELDTEIGCDSELTVDLNTGTVAYGTVDAQADTGPVTGPEGNSTH
ncbi:hypothetical protein OIE69_44330 (plasmid) [Actinacidiphila glaucinigra]|uniref:hypothetical protein n=1 Tax=Actinacidiphila glaucinigra TaxID=235986 RepID=UPI002DDB4FD8|nr:hypothetical protein [Actinacidiphila glaucinigra]WSD65933.1 hypothetical protein OIE69_44330 [Actinacidiphila glaucinigra]